MTFLPCFLLSNGRSLSLSIPCAEHLLLHSSIAIFLNYNHFSWLKEPCKDSAVVAQVTVTWTFNDRWTATPVLWQNLVRASSAVNITKWALAAAGTVGVAAMVVTLVSLKAARLLQQDQS